jgi:hypothetical protein
MPGRSYQTKPGLPSWCQVNIKCFCAKSTCLCSNCRNISSLTLVQKVIPGYLQRTVDNFPWSFAWCSPHDKIMCFNFSSWFFKHMCSNIPSKILVCFCENFISVHYTHDVRADVLHVLEMHYTHDVRADVLHVLEMRHQNLMMDIFISFLAEI